VKTFLKILLAVALLLVAGVLIGWLCLARGWPWWVGAALLLGLVGLATLFLYLRHRRRRKREREFVQRVLAEDDSAIRGAPVHERQALKDLQEHWAESVELLRASYLRKQGNPLYVLPWYLVIGESGAGKTTAIHRSGLSSELGETRRAASIASTRNCDWWFFDQAIVLDTAGRYTIPVDEAPDREEWRRFLELLAHYRRREPINGIVVAVPADQLLAGDATKLAEDALDIRRRIDNLTRSLGASAPVYVMVTKMDRVHGLAAFAAALGDRADQPMGYTNAGQDPHWREVLRRALASVAGRLEQLRTRLVREDPACAPGVLLLPREFARLEPGLETFVRPLFEDNPYLETPVFRGLFFSSAEQSGRPRSDFLEAFGLEPAGAPGEGRGVFLKEFFTAILPRDRHLHRPIRDFLEWRRVRRNLGLVTWTFLWLGALGLLGASFTQNLRAIATFPTNLRAIPTLTGRPQADIMASDQLRLQLIDMKRINHNWWIPRFGLDQSQRMEGMVQNAWLALFRNALLNPVNDAVDRRMADTQTPLDDAQLASYAGYVVTRIAIIQSFLDNPEEDLEHPPAILAHFREASTNLLQEIHPDLSRQIAQLFAENYLANVYWYVDLAERRQKIDRLRWSLGQLLQRNGGNFHWITAGWIADVPAVGLEDFWGEPEQPFGPKPSVPGAFTQAGRKNIQAFLDLTARTLDDPAFFRARGNAFWDWYRQEFRGAWHTFATRFGEGCDGIATALADQRMATTMTGKDNPYFRFLDRLGQELAALDDPSPSSWAVLVERFRKARELAEQQPQPAASGPLDKLEEARRKLIQQWEGRQTPDKAKEFNVCLQASKPLGDYQAAVKDIAPSLFSRQGNYQQMAACFDEGGAAAGDGKGSLYLKAHAALVQMQGILGTGREEQAMWDLVRGPLDYLMAFSLGETAGALQDHWNEQVLDGIRGADPDDLGRLLFAPKDGRVWKFLQGPAKPFIARGERGYAARVGINRNRVPFRDSFIDFLRKGSEGAQLAPAAQGGAPSLPVTLETTPLEVNPGARLAPTGARLCLQTAEGGRTCLENFNYNQDATFKWDPDTAGDVTLTIQFPNLTLTRTYAGRMGFARFLAEFASGARVFQARDFPEAGQRLRDLGVEWIRVAYRIRGAAPVVRALKRTDLEVPRSIVTGQDEDGGVAWN
jgi:type VI secretion system protein ImpL